MTPTGAATTNNERNPMPTAKAAEVQAAEVVPDHLNIYVALAAFQSALPSLTKGSTANVKTRGGDTYSYSYADLSVLVEAILPELGKHGVAWVCVPTLVDGKMFLQYGLHHGASSTSIEGVYPLPSGTPQEVGSAITYARRYTLLSLTGTFPAGEDDDGQKAGDAYRKQQTRQSRPDRPEQPAVEHAPAVDPDAPLVADSDRIAGIETIEALREVYREIVAAQQLDRFVATGESVRDAINARSAQIKAAAATPAAPDEPAAQALTGAGTPVEPESDPA